MSNSDVGPPEPSHKAAVDGTPSTKSGAAQTPENAPPLALTPERIAFLAAALAAVGVSYFWTACSLVWVWEKNPNYSHGYVVPFFAIGLGWVAYTRHKIPPLCNDVSRRDTIVGVVEIGCGVLLHLAAMFLGRVGLLFDVVGLIFILLGVLMVLGGAKANKAFSLPVFFLIFMAPLPTVVYDPVARVLQNFASIVTVALFDVIGEPAVRNGIVIHIREGHVMEVGDACSGLRSLTAILALAVAIAYLSGRGMSYRGLLVFMAAPVAIAVNCVRVFGTGLIMIHIGPEWATGGAHQTEGMIMVGIAAAILAFIAWLMAGVDDWYKEKASASEPAPGGVQPA